jgi:hypothetical protein
MEVTDRLPTHPTDRRAIADSLGAAASAFTALTVGLRSDQVLVACWTKPRFGNDRSYPIRGAAALKMVMGGIFAGSCTNLRFFHEPISRTPNTTIGYRDLFMS